jgi:hypothetical protein
MKESVSTAYNYLSKFLLFITDVAPLLLEKLLVPILLLAIIFYLSFYIIKNLLIILIATIQRLLVRFYEPYLRLTYILEFNVLNDYYLKSSGYVDFVTRKFNRIKN